MKKIKYGFLLVLILIVFGLGIKFLISKRANNDYSTDKKNIKQAERAIIKPEKNEILNHKRTRKQINDNDKSEVTREENIAEIKTNDNIIEVYQSFSMLNSKNECISNAHNLESTNSTNILMSAYSLDNISSYNLYYRVYFNCNWSEWSNLQESIDDVNPKRKIFKPVSIPNSIEKIQFKSTNIVNQKVVFRFFIFRK